MSNFNIFDIDDTDVIAQLHDKLWAEIVPKGGDAESVQGEMIRALGRFGSEMFRNLNNNWIYAKYDVNQEGYETNYVPDFEDDEYDGFEPDFSKCKTTQEELDKASYYDDMLNFIKENVVKYRLDEWSDETLENILYSLERARPAIPIGVYSDDTWQQWDEQNNIDEDDHHEGWNAWSDPDENYANAMIVYWIYRTPDLIDWEGKPLGKSVKHIFEELEREKEDE